MITAKIGREAYVGDVSVITQIGGFGFVEIVFIKGNGRTKESVLDGNIDAVVVIDPEDIFEWLVIEGYAPNVYRNPYTLILINECLSQV